LSLFGVDHYHLATLGSRDQHLLAVGCGCHPDGEAFAGDILPDLQRLRVEDGQCVVRPVADPHLPAVRSHGDSFGTLAGLDIPQLGPGLQVDGGHRARADVGNKGALSIRGNSHHVGDLLAGLDLFVDTAALWAHHE
jgi:hypothetical protein